MRHRKAFTFRDDASIPTYALTVPATRSADFGPDDALPIAPDGTTVDPYVEVTKAQPRAILRATFARLLGGAETEDRRQQREKAIDLLLNVPSSPGRPAIFDYELLLDIARRYLNAFWKERAMPEIRPLVRAALDEQVSERQKGAVEPSSIEQRLERKFRKHAKLLLAILALESDWYEFDRVRRFIAAKVTPRPSDFRHLIHPR